LNCCYETPESFTRAFQKAFGQSPLAFRKTKREHTLFIKLDIEKQYTHQIYDGKIPPLEFVIFKDVKIIGKKILTTLENEQQATDIPRLFSDFIATKRFEQIQNQLHPNHLIGVYTEMTENEEFFFTLGSEVSNTNLIPEGMTFHTLPASKYARFFVEKSTPQDILAAWKYIYGFWMPQSQEQRNQGYDFEVYQDWSLGGPTFIYIPITGGPAYL